MPSKIFKEVKIWKVNGYSIHVELYDSELIVKDENGNRMMITKKEPLSIFLNLEGSFKSD